MGNTQSHSISMNIAPVPTVPLYNKHRCRQNQGSADYYNHSINDSDQSYDHSPGCSLMERGPLNTSSSTSSSHSSREACGGEVRPQEPKGGNESEQALSTPTRTHKRSQGESLSVPAQKVRNFHDTNNCGEQLDGVCQGTQSLNSQSVQRSVIAWVNVDLIMHSYGKDLSSHESVLEKFNGQSNQSAEITVSNHDATAQENLDFDHNTGCISVQVRGDFGTGQFTVEQNRCVQDIQVSSEFCHEQYPSEICNTAEDLQLNRESCGFSMTPHCSMNYNNRDSQNILYSFGPLPGVNTTTSISLASTHGGDTSSFSVADDKQDNSYVKQDHSYDKQENSYDSQMFSASYPSELCNILAFNEFQDSMRSDVSMNSTSSQSTCESSPPANVCTASKTADNGHSFGGSASFIFNEDQELSMGFIPGHYDRSQASFGGGETMYSLAQEGLTSLGFVTRRVGHRYGANNEHVDSISDAQQALPERYDSFQSIPTTSLMSSRLEALSCIPAQTQDNPSFASIKPGSNGKDVVLAKEPTEDKDLSSRPATGSSQVVSTGCINRSSCLLPDDILASSHMRQGSQGGSGKMSEIVPVEEELINENLQIPSCSRTPFAEHPVDDIEDNEPADSNNNLKTVQSTRRSPKHVSFAEPANDALSIFDGPNGYKQYYTAFLCCAPQDLHAFGLSFHAQLEEWGFKIFLPPRDLVLTGCNFDNMSRALEERCNGKIIVILSVNYEASEECSFLTSFARVLDPDARKRNIIPVQIDKVVPIRNVLRGLSIIRYNHDYKCGWLKQKLVDAIAA